MMSAFFSAVSGLKSQTTSLNVISNNISNVNTTGYKSSRVSFSDLLSQTLSSATGANNNNGGTNPLQVGLGVSVASTDTNMSTGSTQSTGIATDAAISGKGFFVVANGANNSFLYTRQGGMTVDEAGNLTVNGNKVCGWSEADNNGKIITTGDVKSINLYDGNKKSMPAATTTKAVFSGTLNSTKTAHGTGLTTIGTVPETADATSSMTVFDAQGNPYSVTVNWYKCYVDGTNPDNPTTSWYYQIDSNDASISPANGYVAFDKNGNIVGSNNSITLGGASTTGYTAASASGSGLPAGTYNVTVGGTGSPYTIALTDPSGATYTTTSADGSATFKTASGTFTLAKPATVAAGSAAFTVTAGSSSFATTPSIAIKPGSGVGTAAFNVALDLSDIATGNSTAGVTATPDGYTAGTLSSIAIEGNGTITGTYSNGQTNELATIALAEFTNDQGLAKNGENLYAATNNSGTVAYYVPGGGGTASLSTGCLEMSNVDLAQEFSNMMISQRAYQANSKIISTADEMLQSLINMR